MTLHLTPRWLTLAAALVFGCVVSSATAQTGTDQAPATIVVMVPADAELFFDGTATMQRGPERTFVTPALVVGKKYHYEVVAKWNQGGKAMEDRRKVAVTGGSISRVDFTRPEPATGLTEDEAFALAVEAYVYGYPLVTMEFTRRVMTNTDVPKDNHAPMGQFHLARTYPDASFKDVTAPNADTLYSTAWLDVGKEPYVFTLPDQGDRYFLMPMLSGWTDVFEVPGTRTTGTKAQKYLITGPGWKGEVPQGFKQLKSPTALVWILGRTYCNGTPEDYKAVHALQDQYKLVPLSAYGKDYTPPRGKVDPNVDMKTPVRDQVNRLDAAAYFRLLAQLMKDNPPAAADAAMVARLAKLGIVPGQDFDPAKLDPAVAKGMSRAVKPGQEKILGYLKTGTKVVNGWEILTKTGIYGTDYTDRAFVTWVGLGANRPQDAVYPMSVADADGKKYTGANKYVIHFDKGQLPPVKGFWSITMYNKELYFVANPLNRYTVSSRFDFKYNADGSLDLYVQHESPGKDREANWLPAPKDEFVLMMRLYWANATPPSILDGSWQPPAVRKVAD